MIRFTYNADSSLCQVARYADDGTTGVANGNGTFQTQTTYAVGSNPVSVTVGDFNGDGRTDLAVANFVSNTVSILLGNGNGTFQTQAQTTYTVTVGSDPKSVAVGDFNGDGKLDLAVANAGSNTVSVLLGNGTGTFQAQTTYAVGVDPDSVAVGDFNGDGKTDLAVANWSSGSSGTVSILLGNGDGTFQAQTTSAVGGGPYPVAVGDFNGDGKVDMAVANTVSNTVSVLLGNGNGTFQTRVQYAVGSDPISVAVGDFNGDGKTDLAVANAGSNSVSVLLGNGNGTFQTQVQYAVGSDPESVAVGDFNGDGKPDLAVANEEGTTVSILLGNGNGTFQAQTTYTAGFEPGSVAVGDFNGDGKIDLVVTNADISILLGNGNGTFQAQTDYAAGTGGPFSVTVGDFNGDGKPDLAMANVNGGTVSILLGTPVQPEASVTVTSSAGSSTYGQTLTLTATVSAVAAASGTPTGTVTFYDGATPLSAPVTLVNGVAGFTTSALNAESHTITALYSGDANFSGNTGAAFQSVNTAPLTITAVNWSKVYGAAMPTLAAAISGFVNGDTVASLATQPTLSTAATSASNVGTYPITANGAVDQNYTIIYVGGTLTVTPQVISVTTTQTTGSLEASGNIQVTIGAGGDLTVTNPVSLDSGGVLNVLGGGRITLPGIDSHAGAGGIDLDDGTLRASGSFTTTAPITVGAGGATIDSNGYGLAIAGTVAGVGGLTMTGSGTVTLSGINAYAGGTTILSGTVVLTAGSALGSGSLDIAGGCLVPGGQLTGAVVTGNASTASAVATNTATAAATTANVAALSIASGSANTIGAEQQPSESSDPAVALTTEFAVPTTLSPSPSMVFASAILSGVGVPSGAGNPAAAATAPTVPLESSVSGQSVTSAVASDSGDDGWAIPIEARRAVEKTGAKQPSRPEPTNSTPKASAVLSIRANPTAQRTFLAGDSRLDAHVICPSKNLATQVTFTAPMNTTAPGAWVRTDAVTFKDGTATLDGSGTAMFSTAALAIGSHTIRGSYGGNTSNAASSGTTSDQINPAVSKSLATSVTSRIQDAALLALLSKSGGV